MQAKSVAKIALIVLLAGALASACAMLLIPYHSGTYTRETIQGMYQQPDDSVQVAFFGTSAPLSAFSPAKLYEVQGVGGYNCSTSVQPIIMSYYLLKDLMRHQAGSLQTVVIDPSIIVDTSEAELASAWAERVLICMQPSLVKLEATHALIEAYPVEALEQYLPILKYHSRWNGLKEADFDLGKSVSATSFSRGQFIRYRANVEDEAEAQAITPNNQGITESIDSNTADLEKRWEPSNKKYLDEFVAYCRDQGIQVVFVKVPRMDWDDSSHDCLQHLANTYDVPFLDFNLPGVFEACDLSYAVDFVDNKHPNIHGSEKLTRYMGEYLVSRYDYPVLDSTVTAALDADVEKYRLCEEDGELLYCTDFGAYLDYLQRDRYTVFIVVRGDASAGMTEEVRKKASALGLQNLATLGEGEAYLAIMNKGKLVTGRYAKSPDQSVRLSGQYKDGEIVITKTNFQKGASIAPLFKLESGGTQSGDFATILVDEEDCSENGEGINIAVFNWENGELIDTACFNTHTDMARTSDVAVD